MSGSHKTVTCECSFPPLYAHYSVRTSRCALVQTIHLDHDVLVVTMPILTVSIAPQANKTSIKKVTTRLASLPAHSNSGTALAECGEAFSEVWGG